MEFFKQIVHETNRGHWSDGFQWMLWTLLLGLFPLWSTILLLLLFSQTISMYQLLQNGEFLLYAASFLGGSIYLVMRDYKTTPFPSRAWVMLILVALTLVASLIFAGIATVTLVDKAVASTVQKLISAAVVESVSWIVFTLAVIASLLVVLADNVRTNPDPGRVRDRQMQTLTTEFDRLGGGGV